MNVIIIKQSEAGGFSISCSSTETVKVIIIEDDKCDNSNVKVDGLDCIAWSTVTEVSQDRVEKILSTYNP
ncbi:hypothetical protein FQP81_18415 [Pseudoalteromonas distincta]|uniref:hypothetical protein n=1 Tax=Pseudoalteromonas TaxID=53246 RepID=UPI000C32688A|nr:MULTISPECIES: hypothetical protein [Pseudoalteromonas]PKG68652.1 hypothetical protein CXF64_20230 [Pseudoalteromonas sp. GutCa3]TVU70431.1 hypothetical protein FQP81_18415 [Pseudoalteromonas elyakovii]